MNRLSDSFISSNINTFAFTLIGLTFLSGSILASVSVSADNDTVVDQINITVPVSCTLSGTGMTSHNAEIVNGTYEDDIGTTTLKAFCNDSEGFAIYAAGYTGNEVGGTDSNKLIGTPTGIGNIETGIATSGNTSNWAMRLTATNDSGDTTGTNALTIDSAPNTSGGADASFAQYHIVPNEYTKVAHKNAATSMDTTNGGATLTTTYAAYMSSNQSAGTYSGQVIYTLVHPASESPSTDISIEDAYAKNGKQKYNGYYKMQEMSDSICSIVTLYDEASQTKLIDIRDNKTYYVAKLQDGNCWMTQNLDHDIVTTQNYYTNENTDIGYNSSTHSYDTTSWTATYATHTSSDTNWCDESTYPSSLYCSYTSIASYDPGELYWNGEAGEWDENQTSTTGDSHYHLGNYYNWGAAIATNDIGSIAEDTLIDRSICPAGWTLPRPGTGTNSFYNLLDNYGFTTSPTSSNQGIWDSPLYLGLLGSIGNSISSKNEDAGFEGAYWTPYLAFNDNGSALLLIVNQYDVYPGNWDSVDGGGTSIGGSVRCVARPVTNTIEGL